MALATLEDTPEDHDSQGVTREQLATYVARQNYLKRLRDENDRHGTWND